MLNGKDMLIDALEKAIANFDVASGQTRSLAFDNTEYKAFLTSFNSPGDIVNLSDSMIDKLSDNLNANESKQNFVATIKFLKNLAELGSDDASISLNSNQLAVIEELKRLIVQTIEKNDTLISVLSETSEETYFKYIKALALMKSNSVLTDKDYDLIEFVTLKLYVRDNGAILEDVMTYLNERNIEKLEQIYKSNILTKEELEEDKKQEKLKKQKETELKQEELQSKLNVRLADYIRRSASKMRKQRELGSSDKIKTIFSYLGFSYNDLSEKLKSQLSKIKNLSEFESFARYLKEKNPIILNSISPDNLVYLLTKSNQKNIEDILYDLTYNHTLSENVIDKFINLITPIFGNENCKKFLMLTALLKEYSADLTTVMGNSPLFFLADQNEIQRIVKLAAKKGVNPKLLLEKCAISLGNNPKLIEKNLKILEVYGFNLEEFFKDEVSAYILLNNARLNTKLDSLIEVGLNEEIHQNPETAASTLRTMIIKRLYYAFKNNLPVWGQTFIAKPEYDEIIKKSNLVIDDSAISLLIAEYPMLEALDDGHRLTIYSATPLALLKRKTEWFYGGKIISRLKTYLIFKILIQNKVPEKEAIIYALIYRTNLDNAEYNLIKNAALGAGMI